MSSVGGAGASSSASPSRRMSSAAKNESTRQVRLPLNPIKRIVSTTPECATTSKDLPLLLSKAAELFLLELTKKAYDCTPSNMPTLLRYDDLAKAIASDSRFFFLSEHIPERQRYGDIKEALAKQRQAVTTGQEDEPLPPPTDIEATNTVISNVLAAAKEAQVVKAVKSARAYKAARTTAARASDGSKSKPPKAKPSRAEEETRAAEGSDAGSDAGKRKSAAVTSAAEEQAPQAKKDKPSTNGQARGAAQ